MLKELLIDALKKAVAFVDNERPAHAECAIHSAYELYILWATRILAARNTVEQFKQVRNNNENTNDITLDP